MRKLITLLLMLCICLTASAYKLPDLPGDNGLTPWQEQAMGRQFFAYIRANVPLVQDRLARDYISNLGFHLASFSKDPSQHFYFFIVKSSDVNAFAGPNGYIGINSGLILFSQTEGELAAVMAHEISHVTQHHLARAMQKASRRTLATLGAIIGAIVVGNPNIAAGAATTGIAANAQMRISYTRSQEKEADRVGIKVLSKAGFNPKDMAKMFKLMQKNNYNDTPNRFEFLSTHPFFNSRIADAEDQASHYPPHKDHSSIEYFLVKARLASELTSSPESYLQSIKKARDKHPNQAVIEYNYALALRNLNKYSMAEKILKKLIRRYPLEFFYPYTLAETQAMANQLPAALSSLKLLNDNFTDYYPVILLYGKTLIQAQKAKEAVSFLKPYVDEYSERLAFLSLYSSALGKAGDLADAYKIRARAYLLVGRKQAAINQIETALKLKTLSRYEKSALTAFLKDIQNGFRLQNLKLKKS